MNAASISGERKQNRKEQPSSITFASPVDRSPVPGAVEIEHLQPTDLRFV
jgi:hypothetical protein